MAILIICFIALFVVAILVEIYKPDWHNDLPSWKDDPNQKDGHW